MQLAPRYDAPPVLSVEPTSADRGAALLRQRRRLATFLTTLSDDAWAAPSRCAGWSVQDVVAHLIGTNHFWVISVGAGLAGEPTRLLSTFDPVATPAAMVAGMRKLSSAETLARYVESVEALAGVVGNLDGPAWSLPADAPPGHLAIRDVALHALWDAWTHERDILLPLGEVPALEPDEVDLSLRYAAGLGPALAATNGSTRSGALGVAASEPDVCCWVEIGAAVVVRDGPGPVGAPSLRGRAVDLIEGLSYRAPLAHQLGPRERWLVGGLGDVFDLSPAPARP